MVPARTEEERQDEADLAEPEASKHNSRLDCVGQRAILRYNFPLEKGFRQHDCGLMYVCPFGCVPVR